MTAKKPMRLRKIRDEGTSEPFYARVWVAIFEARDQMLDSSVLPVDREKRRAEFDRLYNAPLIALETARTAARQAATLVSGHAARVASGEIVEFQQHALQVNESIDTQLHDAVARLLVNGVIGLKKLQDVTKFCGIDIGGFYREQGAFQSTIEELRGAGHGTLAEYLAAARSIWSESFIARRAALEHQGWTLPTVDYAQPDSGGVAIVEPQIDALGVSEFATLSLRRLLAFAETVVVYALKTRMQGVTVAEIAVADRDPAIPRRFKFVPLPLRWMQDPRTGMWLREQEWTPVYSDDDFAQ